MSHDIDTLRLRAAAVLRGLTHPPLGMAAALAEECGELSKLLLDRYAYGKALPAAKLGDELADVFLCLCEIATIHGIELGPAVDQKLTKIARLAPEWRSELGDFLERAGGGTLSPVPRGSDDSAGPACPG